jgi:hypothetical protein
MNNSKEAKRNLEISTATRKDISLPPESMLSNVPSETVGEIFFRGHQDLLLCRRVSFATRGKK